MNYKKRFIKLLLPIMGLVCVLLTNCGENEFEQTISQAESQLSLIAPSGMKIISDIPSLKLKTASIIEETFGECKEFEIISINYDNIKQGFIAEIEYLTEDGILSNYFYMSSDVTIVDSEGIEIRSIPIRTKSGSEIESTEDVQGKQATCSRISGGSCTRGCRAIKHKLSNGNIRYVCSCEEGLTEGCALVIKD